MLKHSLTLLAMLGILIAVFGIGVDYLLPGTSPGFNLPQLLIVAAGLALFIAAVHLRRQKARGRHFVRSGKTIATVAIISLLTLLGLEIVLTLWGMPTYFPSELPDNDVQVASWQICDEQDCRLNYASIMDSCADGEFTGRFCIINRQGYADAEDFVVREDFDERTRILMMGDSFTQGYSADLGKSFVEFLESALPGVIIWNVAISSTGTTQDLKGFAEFAPSLKPHLSILGFFMNDFHDNLFDRSVGMQLRDSDGRMYFLRYSQVDRWGNPFKLPDEVIYAYAAAGSPPPTSELERVAGLTRLGTLTLRLLDSLGTLVFDTSRGSVFDESIERQDQLTRGYLTQLRDAARTQDSSLLVLLIPRRTDIGSPSEHYQLALQLMDELSIAYMNPIDMLYPVADYATEPDVHWSNAGHQKIGAYLSECVAAFIVSNDLADCENVVMP